MSCSTDPETLSVRRLRFRLCGSCNVCEHFRTDDSDSCEQLADDLNEISLSECVLVEDKSHGVAFREVSLYASEISDDRTGYAILSDNLETLERIKRIVCGESCLLNSCDCGSGRNEYIVLSFVSELCDCVDDCSSVNLGLDLCYADGGACGRGF